MSTTKQSEHRLKSATTLGSYVTRSVVYHLTCVVNLTTFENVDSNVLTFGMLSRDQYPARWYPARCWQVRIDVIFEIRGSKAKFPLERWNSNLELFESKNSIQSDRKVFAAVETDTIPGYFCLHKNCDGLWPVNESHRKSTFQTIVARLQTDLTSEKLRYQVNSTRNWLETLKHCDAKSWAVAVRLNSAWKPVF